MALDLSLTTQYGINTEHNVIQHISVDRTKNSLLFGIDQFVDAPIYVSGYTGLNLMQYQFNFNILPASIMTKIGELKSLIEIEMINNLPEWSGATQTYDDGTPI